MVKTFKRSAAGYDEQLPSDLRPPSILKKTCDYLFHIVIGEATSLAKVHHFVWDRTRAIRNDFSIQQCSKLDDLQIAIDCFERIARFHIVSLHQLALKDKAYEAYDPQQEREQLDRTLLSLVQYYDDSHGRIVLQNEAEFRAYQVLFQLQQRIPDLEDRIQSWPLNIQRDSRVQVALKVYAAACNTEDLQGPFGKLATPHAIAQQDWQEFWQIIVSSKVTYLMACVSEIYFNLIRQMALKNIIKSMRIAKPGVALMEWDIDSLMDILSFDDEEQLEDFCSRYGLGFKTGEVESKDGNGKVSTRFLDTGSLVGRSLPEPETGRRPTQLKSYLVENKRKGRTLPAVIDGFSIWQAQEAGMIEAVEGYDEEMEEDDHGGDQNKAADEDSTLDNNDSLFVPEAKVNSEPQKLANGIETQAPAAAPATTSGFNFGQPSTKPSLFQTSAQKSPFSQPSSQTSAFGRPSAGGFGQPSSGGFGQPSTSGFGKPSSGGFGQPSANTSPFAGSPFASKPKPAAEDEKTQEEKQDEKPSMFSFSNGATTPRETAPSEPAKSLNLGAFNPAGAAPTKNSPNPSPFAKPSQSSANTVKNPFAAKPVTDSSATGELFPGLAGTATSASARTNPFLEATKPGSSEVESSTIVKNDNTAPLSFFPNQATTAAPSLYLETAKTTSLQPHVSSATATSTSTSTSTQDASNAPHNNQSLSPVRRQSINAGQDTKPKRPSPLSNSFTASEEGAPLGAAQRIEKIPEKQSASGPFPGQLAQGPISKLAKPSAPELFPPRVASAEARLDAVVARLADELVTHPTAGYLKQLIDHYAKVIVTGVQEKIYLERINQEAVEFRQFFLEDKYGKRWRDQCRLRRLKKSAIARRQRAHKRLRESQRGDALEGGDLVEMGSTQSKPRGAATRSREQPSRHEQVDALFRSTNGMSRSAANRQARAGSKRPASTIDNESVISGNENAHKRTKSASRASNDGMSISTQNSDILERSSFLGFSLAPDAPNRTSTTTTNYFRVKALGIKPAPTQVAGSKRARSDSLDAASAKLKASTVARHYASLSSAEDTALMPPPASTRSIRSKMSDDDEVLFARLRAARESLKDSGNFLKSELAKEDELRRSRSASRSDHESPSLELARSEARLRASSTGSGLGSSQSTRDVPAYRLRESRFVPREHYSKAIERANEIRASRSRENSRPSPRNEQHAAASIDGSTAPKAEGFQAPTEENALFDQVEPITNGNHDTSNTDVVPDTEPAVQVAEVNTSFGTSSKSPFFTALPQETMQQQIGPDPFSQSSSFAPVVDSSSNPFLQATTPQAPTDDTAAQVPELGFGFGQAPQSLADDLSQATTATFAAANKSQPFSGFASQPSWGFETAPEEPDHPGDHTIQPDDIPAALSQSFGAPSAPQKSIFAAKTKSPTPLQPNSFMPSQSEEISLISDDEEEGAVDDDDGGYDNFNETEAAADLESAEDDSASDEEAGSAGAYTGQFAALADEGYDDDEIDTEGSERDPEETSEQDDSGAEYESQIDEAEHYDSYQHGNPLEPEDLVDDEAEESDEDQPNGHRSEHSDEEEEVYDDDGEELEGEVEYDEEEYDEDEEEGDEEMYANAYQARYGQQSYHFPPKPQPDPELLAVGNNEEEPIELDSD